jgi:predicted ATPase
MPQQAIVPQQAEVCFPGDLMDLHGSDGTMRLIVTILLLLSKNP